MTNAAASAAVQAEETPTAYALMGGQPTIAAVVNRFYDLMEEDPAYARLRALHAPDLGPMRESLTGFLVGWTGGPRDWFAKGGCVMSAHKPFAIDAELRDQWVHAMTRAITEQDIPNAMGDMFAQALGRMADGMRNR